MAETDVTSDADKETPVDEIKTVVTKTVNPFVYTDTTIPLTELNRKTRQLQAERRADLDEKHDVVQKAVRAAFGKTRDTKPVVPKGSSKASELKAEAAKAAAKK